MGIKSQPVNFALERWMRMPGLPTSSYLLSRRDLFAFSGYADFTSNEPLPTLIPTGITPNLPTPPEPLKGQGAANTDDQEIWVEYDIEELVVCPIGEQLMASANGDYRRSLTSLAGCC